MDLLDLEFWDDWVADTEDFKNKGKKKFQYNEEEV